MTTSAFPLRFRILFAWAILVLVVIGPLFLAGLPTIQANFHRKKAESFVREEKFTDALREANSAIKLEPNSAELLFIRGQIHQELSSFSEAAKDLDAAGSALKQDGLSRIYIKIAAADAYLRIGDLETAMTRVRECDELLAKPTILGLDQLLHSEFLNNTAYFRAVANQDLDKASSAIETATRWRSDTAHYLDTRAFVLYRKKDYAKALEDIEASLKLLNYPEVLKELDAKDKGVSYGRKLAKSLAVTLYHRVLILEALEKPDEAAKDRETIEKKLGQKISDQLF